LTVVIEGVEIVVHEADEPDQTKPRSGTFTERAYLLLDILDQQAGSVSMAAACFQRTNRDRPSCGWACSL